MSEEASLLSGTRCVVSTLYMQHACTVDYILQQMQRRSQWRGNCAGLIAYYLVFLGLVN